MTSLHPVTGSRLAGPILLSLLLVSLLGCGPRASQVATSQRLLEDEPVDVFRVEDFAEEEEVFAWSFGDVEHRDSWSLQGFEELGLAQGALELRASSNDGQVIWDEPFDAAEVQRIRVESRGPLGQILQLFWAGPGEDFKQARSLMLQSNRRLPTEEVYEFFVGGHPLWQGRIARLRLDPTTHWGEEIRLEKISGLGYRLGPEALEEISAKAWKIELENEMRNSRLGLPGKPIEWQVEVPSKGELRFGYGFLGGVSVGQAEVGGASPHLRIRLFADGRESNLLFETSSGANSDTGSGWADIGLDLGEHAGESLTLIFETLSSAPDRAIQPLPVWTFPEIVPVGADRPRPSVILISLDTLRGDHLSINGYERPTSPVIDSWAERRAVNFEKAIVSAPWTLPSHLSMLTGLDALSHGVHHDRPAPNELTMLAELLREGGYKTLAVTGGAYLRPDYGFSQGFDAYRYWPALAADGRELASGLRQALSWIDSHADRPFFLFFHTYEIHFPFRPREPFYSRLGGALEDPEGKLRQRQRQLLREDGFVSQMEFLWKASPERPPEPLSEALQQEVVHLYDAGISYTDAQLGQLFERLEELGLSENTIVILTSDHGESLGEHGRAGHIHLHDDNLRVPLIAAYPRGLPAGRSIGDQVRSVDIVPTILELVGIPPPEGLDGRSLVALARGEGSYGSPPAWSYAASGNYGVSLRLGNELKYIYKNMPWSPLRGREELFLLAEDPAELVELSLERPAETEALRKRARAVLERRPGLKLRLVNDGPGFYRGTLHADYLQTNTIKTAELPCDCVSWAGPSGIRFEVPSGVSYTLTLENVRADPLVLEGAWYREAGGTGVDFELAIAPEDLSEPVVLSLDDQVWRKAPGLSARTETAIIVGWHGGVNVAEPSPSEDDEALQEQLRALGYLE